MGYVAWVQKLGLVWKDAEIASALSRLAEAFPVIPEANVQQIAVRVQMGWALFRVEVQRTRCLVCWRQEGW